MITLIFSVVEAIDIGLILGYILSACEILIVVCTLISYFVDPASKFGKFLSKFMKGLFKSKTYLSNIEDQDDDNSKDANNNNEEGE